MNFNLQRVRTSLLSVCSILQFYDYTIYWREIMATATEYQGTKLQDIDTITDIGTIESAKILIITADNQYLVSFQDLVNILKAKVRN